MSENFRKNVCFQVGLFVYFPRVCVSESEREGDCDTTGCYNSAELQEEVKLLGHSM